MIRILLAALLALPVIALAKAPQVNPALWKVSSKSATVYLFGSIHALPKGLEWRTPALIKAEAEADTLVLEVGSLDDKAALAKTFQSLALSPNLPDVLDRVPPSKRAGLKALLDKSGLPLTALKPLETWAITLSLTPFILKQLEIDPASGVEPNLTADFKAAHKPVEGLETAAYQFGVFDHLSEAAQRRMLVSSVDDMKTAKQDFGAMLRAWKAGDPAAIAKNFDKDLNTEPELRRALLHNRNANWAGWIVARLKGKGTTLIAVGAGHLAGNDSVIAMLRRQGLSVQRVGCHKSSCQ